MRRWEERLSMTWLRKPVTRTRQADSAAPEEGPLTGRLSQCPSSEVWPTQTLGVASRWQWVSYRLVYYRIKDSYVRMLLLLLNKIMCPWSETNEDSPRRQKVHSTGSCLPLTPGQVIRLMNYSFFFIFLVCLFWPSLVGKVLFWKKTLPYVICTPPLICPLI